MTIYTSKVADKKDASDSEGPEVLRECLTEKEPATAVVTLATHQRRNTCRNLAVLLTALIVLATGIIGGLCLYKHITRRSFHGWCGVKYYDYEDAGPYSEKQRVWGSFEEEVEIDHVEGRFERINAPHYKDYDRATILHDFEKNLTAFVFRGRKQCFVKELNRRLVKPPRNFWDLIRKIETGYYMPDTRLVREQYRVLLPPVLDLSRFGQYIYQECAQFQTFKLRRRDQPYALSKRSAGLEKSACVRYFAGSVVEDVCIA